jgi:hypothetical protein
MVELESAHTALYLDILPGLSYWNGARPFRSPGRLLFRTGQATEQQKLLNVQKRLREISEFRQN